MKHAEANEALADRFWAKVDKETTECWVWTASRTKKGYGHFNVSGAPQRAHRFSWQLHNGDIPENMHVLHKCDNPGCVRPDHLFLGTNSENMSDKISKGREKHARHEKHGHVKLTSRQVIEIKCLRGVLPRRMVANIYNCSLSNVTNIQTDYSWYPHGVVRRKSTKATTPFPLAKD